MLEKAVFNHVISWWFQTYGFQILRLYISSFLFYIPKTSVNVPISSGHCLLGRRSRWRLISLTLVPKNRYPSSSSCFSSCSVVFWFRHFGVSWNFTRKCHGECTRQSINTRFELRSRKNQNTFWNKIVIFFSIHNLFWGGDHKIFGDVLCWRRRCSTM